MQHFQIRIVALDTPVTGMLHGVRGLDYRFVKKMTSDDRVIITRVVNDQLGPMNNASYDPDDPK